MLDGSSCGDAMRPEGGSRSGGDSSRVWGCYVCWLFSFYGFLCRLCFAQYGQEERVGGSSNVCRGACFVALQDSDVYDDSLDYSGGVCDYVGQGEGYFVFEAGLVFHVAEGMPCIVMYEDNEGAILVAKHPISNSNSKHSDVKHHFLRELVERKEIEIIHVASQYQHTDFLTKALPEREFECHRGIVMNLM